MAKEKSKRTKKAVDDFALRPPKLSILSDHPLKEDVAYDTDRFNLRYWVGPVYDIIRHEKTDMPMTIAIYGGWGTGKTTAMKWLHGLLDDWNEKPTNRIKVWPVWFYPWKYDKKEDVWRGLIAEVILKILESKKASAKNIITSARRFGGFLGKSFLSALESLNLKISAKVVEAESDVGKAIENIKKEWEKEYHHEKAFLNEFENTLSEWIKDKNNLSENERMVIFIDDLDRCMPEIALPVLEALKLYLNIEKLIFIVGVDNVIVEKLVVEHYRRLGLLKGEKEKAREGEKEDIIIDKQGAENYLAKMFQVEVALAPNEQQIRDYLSDLLSKITYWNENLSTEYQKLFRGILLELAGRNPREVKRILSSAMMAGAGTEMIKVEKGKHRPTFAQGLQDFFIRKILKDYYGTIDKMVDTDNGRDFLGEWSQFVIEHKGDKRLREILPDYLVKPDDFQTEDK